MLPKTFQFKAANLYFFLIFLSGFLIYANSLTNPFIWDDQVLIVHNPALRQLGSILTAFSTDLSFARETTASYRPLVNISFIIDYAFWKLSSFGYHLTNILLHLSCAAMLFSLLQRFLAKDELFAFCVSLIFVSHPLQTNVVTYISGRADALAFFFVLAAFMGYLRFLKLQKRHYAVIAGTSYALALFSKETAAIFIVIPLLYDYTFLSSFQRGQLRLRRFLVYAILLFVSLLYLVMRYLALKSLVGGSYGLYPALVQRLLPMPIVFFRYLWLLLFPYGLSLSHQVFIPGSFLEAKTLTAILAWIVITVFTIISKRYSRIIFFGSAWFLLNLAAITNVLPLNAYMHEAWLYPGLAGFFIALVDLGFQWKRRATVVLLLVALILFSVITIKRNLDYRDPVILYKKTLSQSPGNLKVYHNLGLVYLERGQLDEAIISFKNAIRLKPDLAGSYFALGYSYEKKSELDAARKSYEQALRINPEFSVAREFLMRLNQQDVRK